jgi:hypothetical protein
MHGHLMAMEILKLTMVNWPLETRMICERVVRSTIFNRRLSVFHFPLA